MFKNLKQKLRAGVNEAQQSGKRFTGTLSIDTVISALQAGAYLPAVIRTTTGKIPAASLIPQESLFEVELLPDRLVIYSHKSNSAPVTQAFSAAPTISLQLVKHLLMGYGIPRTQVYLLLTIQDDAQRYHIVNSGVRDLAQVLTALQALAPTLAENDRKYLQITDPEELAKALQADDQIPRLPQNALVFPM